MSQNIHITEETKAADVRDCAVRSVKWSSLAEIASRTIRPLVSLILARILTPADFGVVGLALMATQFAIMLQGFGLGKTLIQRETDIESATNVVFWLNVGLSVPLCLVVVVLAPLLSRMFHEPRLLNVLRILSLQIIVLGFTSVHQALLLRDFQFKQLCVIRISASILSGLLSIYLAVSGFGIWALVWGTLAGVILQAALFWILDPWRPMLSFDIPLAREMVAFGAWVALEMFLWWVLLSGTQGITGYFLGVQKLGVYRVGVTFVTLIFGTMFEPLGRIAYSSFSRLQSDREELTRFYLRAVQLIRPFSLLIGIILLLLADEISTALFGQKWAGSGSVMGIFGFSSALALCFTGLNFELYRAMGKPDLNSKVLFVTAIAYVFTYSLAAPHGLVVLCSARLVLIMVSISVHLLIISTQLSLSSPYRQLLGTMKSPSISGIIMALYILSFRQLIGITDRWLLSVAIVSGTIIYFACLLLIDRRILKDLLNISLKGLRDNSPSMAHH